ncbi:ABC transporter ATP-binding protein [Paenibacillus sp. RC67]|uniref:ABC transporter ATP-binding protein n=1 Tax=Paenibacillus sp. RC67 TaxID=3039392 RepID=UPI0024ACE74A|nr:ABC transporter ATP-binding protein [Paenibacillus sp. RC67]
MFPFPEWLTFFTKQLLRSKGTLLLVSLLTIAVTMCSALSPVYIGRIIDELTKQPSTGLPRLAGFLLASLLFNELFIVIRKYVSTKAMIQLTYEWIHNSLSAILNTSADFFVRTPRGEMLQRCIQDIRTIQKFGLFTLPGFVQEWLLACTAIIVISNIYWPITVMIIGCYVVLFIPVYFFAKKRSHSRKQLILHNAVLRQSLLEKLESIKQIKIFGTEKQEYNQFHAEQQHWAALSYQEGIINATYKGFPRIPDALAPALVFLFVGWQVMMGNVTFGQLMTIIAFIPALNAPVRTFFGLFVVLADIRLRIQGLLEYVHLPVEPGKRTGLQQLPDDRELPISFHNVTVLKERGTILNDVSFTIQPGEHIAIVGPSGAGKSTLLKLLTRLQEPSAGEIRIGGIPLHKLDATHLRRRVGYMTQEPVLFRETLLNNLTLLHPAERSEVEAWMQALGAEDIAARLPDGYDTVIGDGGSSLSGGQRQLVGLIRVLLKQPDLLLLDEATSSLDQTSEALVLHALEKQMQRTTRISVTHRLRGARLADRIFVIDQGQLIQVGTHDELLLEQDSVYAKLWFSELQQAESGQAVEHQRERGDLSYV